jgi:hypothetical protein
MSQLSQPEALRSLCWCGHGLSWDCKPCARVLGNFEQLGFIKMICKVTPFPLHALPRGKRFFWTKIPHAYQPTGLCCSAVARLCRIISKLAQDAMPVNSQVLPGYPACRHSIKFDHSIPWSSLVLLSNVANMKLKEAVPWVVQTPLHTWWVVNCGRSKEWQGNARFQSLSNRFDSCSFEHASLDSIRTLESDCFRCFS